MRQSSSCGSVLQGAAQEQEQSWGGLWRRPAHLVMVNVVGAAGLGGSLW